METPDKDQHVVDIPETKESIAYPTHPTHPAELDSQKPGLERRCADDYAIYVAKKCRIRRELHNEAREHYSRLFHILSIASILLGFVITAVSQLPQDISWLRYVLLLLTVSSTALSTALKFLKYESLITEHQAAAHKYLQLRDSIRLKVCSSDYKLGVQQDAFITHISDQYEMALGASPPVTKACEEGTAAPSALPGAFEELLCDNCSE